MSNDQLMKRLQWIEDERRKERDTVALLENRINEIQGALKGLTEQIQEISAETSRQATIITRMDAFDDNLGQLRTETRKIIDTNEKEARRLNEEADKVRLVEIRALEASISENKKSLEVLPRIRKICRQGSKKMSACSE